MQGNDRTVSHFGTRQDQPNNRDRYYQGFPHRPGQTYLIGPQETIQFEINTANRDRRNKPAHRKWRTNSPLFKFVRVMLTHATNGGAISPRRQLPRMSTATTKTPSPKDRHPVFRRASSSTVQLSKLAKTQDVGKTTTLVERQRSTAVSQPKSRYFLIGSPTCHL